MLPDSGEKKPFLPPPARESRSVSTDGRRFWRSAGTALLTLPISRAAVPGVPDVMLGARPNLGQNPPSLLSQFCPEIVPQGYVEIKK